jgi:WD40 repeat protein
MTATDSSLAPDSPLQVFLSYSRQDLGRAEHVREQLIAAGFGAYLDKHDILPGEPWQERLARLIETADSVVFLLSPDSVASAICDWEVNEAERLFKRILPVVIRDVSAGDVPGRLKRLNYIFLRDAVEQVAGFAQLNAALRVNVDWVREHTRLGSLAAEWGRRDRAPDLLLRGAALAASELWLSQPQALGQAPTELHREFITTSRTAEARHLAQEQAQVARTRRFQRRASWALAGVALTLVAGGVAAVLTYRETSKRAAEVFTSKASEAIEKGQLPLALRYAVAGLPADGALPLDHWSPALERLLAGLAPQHKPVLATLQGHQKGYGADILVDPGLDRVLVLGSGEATLWDTRDGRVLRAMPWVSSTAFNAQLKNGRAVAFDGSTLRILDAETGVELGTHGGLAGFRLYANRSGSHVLAAWSRPTDGQAVQPPTPLVRSFSLITAQAQTAVEASDGVDYQADLSPDGHRAAYINQSGVAQLVDLASGRILLSLGPADPAVSVFKLSPDGSRALAIVDSGRVRDGRVFDARDGRLLARIDGIPRMPDQGVELPDHYIIAEKGDFLYRAYSVSLPPDAMPQIQVWDLGSGAELLDYRRTKCFRPQVSAYMSGTPPVPRAAVVCHQQEIFSPEARASEAISGDETELPIVISPANDRLAVGGFGGYHLHDSNTGRRIVPQRISDRIYGPIFSEDGSRVYGQIIDRDKDVTVASLRDARTGAIVNGIDPVEAVTQNRRPVQVDSAEFSAQGTWLVTKHWSAVVLRDGKTGREVARVLPDPNARPAVGLTKFAGPREDRLITSHDDGSIRLWDIAWQPQQGRQLVETVCRQLLLGPEQRFTDTQMKDPILNGRADLRSPCARLGPLRWAWWRNLLVW